MGQLVWRWILVVWLLGSEAIVARETVGNAVPCDNIHKNSEAVFRISPTFFSNCSAVWIEIPDPSARYDVALTAGHCAGITGESRPVIENTSIAAVANFVTKSTEELWRSRDALKKWDDRVHSQKDLGVLLFPLGTAAKLGIRTKPRIAPFRHKLAKQDEIEMAGFADKSTRSCGRAKIFDVTDNLIILQAAPKEKESYSEPGDSGGGVFSPDGQLIGIFSAGERANKSPDGKHHSIMVRTTSEFAYGMWSAVQHSADWVPQFAPLENERKAEQAKEPAITEGAILYAPETEIETIPSILQYRLITQKTQHTTPLVISYFDATKTDDFKPEDKRLESFLRNLQARINTSEESDRPLMFRVLVTPEIKSKIANLPSELPAIGVFAVGTKIPEFVKVEQGNATALESLLAKHGYQVPELKTKQKEEAPPPDNAIIAATKATLRNAFPAFAHRSNLAVPIDLIRAHTRIAFDASSGSETKATGEALLEFRTGQSGMPVFDIDCPILEGSINGQKVERFDEVVPPGGKATVFVVPTNVAPYQLHQLRIKYRLKKGIKIKRGEVVAKFSMSDLADLNSQAAKTYWQPYGPTSFEYDAYEHKLSVSILGAETPHRVFTNGRVTNDREGDSWSIHYPAYFNNSSILFYLAPKKKYAVLEEKIHGRDATIPITVFSESSEKARTLMSEAPGIVADLEERFGPYPHESLLIYGWDGDLFGAAGMEYAGATETNSYALRHELQHSWFARSIMPANGAAGWIDEACARWGDDGFKRGGTPRATANLSAVSPFSWKTISEAYSEGGAFIAYLHNRFYGYQYEGQHGMIGLFRKLHAERKRTPLSVFEFQAFLERETQTNLAGEFDRYIFAGRRQQHAELYASLADPKPGAVADIPAGGDSDFARKDSDFASVEIVDLLAKGNNDREGNSEYGSLEELFSRFRDRDTDRRNGEDDERVSEDYRERIIAGEDAEIPRERLEGAIEYLVGWGTVPKGTTIEDLERMLAARGYRGRLIGSRGSRGTLPPPGPAPRPEPRPAPKTPPPEPSPVPSPQSPARVQHVNIATDCPPCAPWKAAIAGSESFNPRLYEGKTHALYGDNKVEYRIRWFRSLEEAGDAGVEGCPDVAFPTGVRLSRARRSPDGHQVQVTRAGLSQADASQLITRRLHEAGYRRGETISRETLEGAIRFLEDSGTVPRGTTIEDLERRLQAVGR